MRVTVELPDALMRRVKVQAAMTDRKIKDLVAKLLELGLESNAAVRTSRAPPQPPRRRRSRR